MLDTKSIMQLVLNLIDQRIVELAVWFYQMRRQRDFRRAHRPDVQIVHLCNPRKRAQILLDRIKIDIFRDTLQRQIDRLASKSHVPQTITAQISRLTTGHPVPACE